jgi:hypothetical protein
MPGRFRILALVLPLLAAGCGPSVDLKQSVAVTELSSGWFDAGVVNGKNKLVPSVHFRLRKAQPDVNLDSLSLNVVFKREGETEPWDDIYLQRVPFSADGQTEPLMVRLDNGYTGDPPQSRLDMLKNSQFVDLHAQIMAKQPSGQWVELQKLTIERRLLTQ